MANSLHPPRLRHMNTENTVILQKADTGWMMFESPVDILQADRQDQVRKTLASVEEAVSAGLFAAGFITYEAAPGFDKAFRTHPASDIPLVWFGLYRNVEETISQPLFHERTFTVGEWRPSVSEAEYLGTIARIRSYIAAGDTYQVNYTIRLRAAFQGDPYSFFSSLCRAQRGNNCAFISFDGHSICSASPELFFALNGRSVVSRPMKGTAQRGLTYDVDMANAGALRKSEKNRAENIMIVDMIRNDLGRVADAGSVRVSSVFDIERYPTVFQMTSTVEAQTPASPCEILAALFPCASVTGAPKVHTMEIIKELETAPRGIYTGAIGYIAPSGPVSARFNVAIRTVVIDKKSGIAEYGVGGGIVWESEAEDEYRECLAKASVLTIELPEFDLFETMLWTPDEGYFLLELHLRRLGRSAEYFDFDIFPERITERLIKFAVSLPAGDQRVRLRLERNGEVFLESTAIQNKETRKPVQVGFAAGPVDSNSPFLYHKTTNRSVYDSARASRPHCDDVILYNERDEITETVIANIVVVMNGERLTPPVECGLLAGTFREQLIERGEIKEAVIKTGELEKADEIYLVNSVRKWMPAHFAK